MPKNVLAWLLAVILLVGLGMAGCRPAPEKHPAEPEAGDESFAGDESKISEAEEEAEEMDDRQAEPEAPPKELKLQFLGHSCFLLEADGLRILMDPYSPGTGYGTLDLEAEIITVSHEHDDHNYTGAAPGAKVIKGLTPDALGWEDVSLSFGDIHVSTLATYHDDTAGKSRGRNAVFIFDMDDFRLVHLGDLGHIFNESDVEKLKDVDVLMIPVGGHYTIDAAEAKEIVEQLLPPVVIPMHYKTDVTSNWPIAELSIFLEGEKNVKEKGPDPVTISSDKLPGNTEIWVFKPAEP